MKTTSDHAVSLTPKTIILTIAILLGLYFVYEIWNIIILFFLAFVLMTALNPIAHKIQRFSRLNRGFSLVVTYVFVIALIVAILWVLIPPLGYELSGLLRFVDIPVLQQELSELTFSVRELSTMIQQLGASFGTVLSVITSTFSGVFAAFTVIVMSFFMLKDRSNLHKKMFWFTKKENEITKAEKLLDEIEHQLGGWVRAELILMFTIGLLTFIGLTALGIKYALPLAILAGLLEILPNIGPTIAAIPAIVIAFITVGPLMALAVLVLAIIVQQLENNIIVPKIMSDSCDVNPLVTILAILIGMQLGGFLGALLAVPAYIVTRVVYSAYFLKNRPS